MSNINQDDEIDRIIQEVLQEETANPKRRATKAVNEELDGEEHFGFSMPCKNGGCD